MWFFGCDAACADGNLLVRYGFHRYREAEHPGDSSRYRLRWCPAAGTGLPDAQVDLHGWCAGLHPLGTHRMEGGFLYTRDRNRLGWYDAPAPPVPGDYDSRVFHTLGRRPETGFCQAAARFLAWVSEYENWIEGTCGPRYRSRCFERAPLPWLPPFEGRAWLASYRQHLLLAGNPSHPLDPTDAH